LRYFEKVLDEIAMEIPQDYRDTLQQLLDDLRLKQGMTLSQISKRSGMSEQMIMGVLRKERNLSARSLTRLLNRMGYSISFEKIEIPPPIQVGGNGLVPEIISPAS
jgi:transcriptional regulator with XRE-family HTH domain